MDASPIENHRADPSGHSEWLLAQLSYPILTLLPWQYAFAVSRARVEQFCFHEVTAYPRRVKQLWGVEGHALYWVCEFASTTMSVWGATSRRQCARRHDLAEVEQVGCWNIDPSSHVI